MMSEVLSASQAETREPIVLWSVMGLGLALLKLYLGVWCGACTGELAVLCVA